MIPETQATPFEPVSVRASRNAPYPLVANPKNIATAWTVNGQIPKKEGKEKQGYAVRVLAKREGIAEGVEGPSGSGCCSTGGGKREVEVGGRSACFEALERESGSKKQGCSLEKGQKASHC